MHCLSSPGGISGPLADEIIAYLWLVMIVSQDWAGRQSGWGFSERHDPVRKVYTDLSTSALQKDSSRLYFYLHEWRKAHKLLTSEIPCSAITLNKLCGLNESKRKIVNYNSGSH